MEVVYRFTVYYQEHTVDSFACSIFLTSCSSKNATLSCIV